MAELRTALTETENVLIRAGDCTVTLLPLYGGKIASIRIGEQELLQQPLAPIASRTRTMTFDSGDASGWDECLPSVAACRVETDTGAVEIPDHGDLWRVEWKDSERKTVNRVQSDGSLALTGECFSLPLELERRVLLEEMQSGWRLQLRYKLTNTGSSAAPWSWAAHPLFAVEEGDRVVLPESIASLRVEGSGGGRLGKDGDTVTWPVAKLAGGGVTDLRVAKAPDSGIGYKLFAGPLAPSENWCALERPSAGVRLKVKFDAEATPYLGLWICYGGWPEGRGPKQMCLAMEPATAPVDSLAATGPWSRALGPGDCFSWPMEVEIERTVERIER
jgi:galactose mutarotase-like enzyme